MPKVRIESKNGIPWQTHITHSETGETIPGIFAFEITQDVSHPTHSDYTSITLHAWVGRIDVSGDATIVSHCPHCEKELPLYAPLRTHEISFEDVSGSSLAVGDGRSNERNEESITSNTVQKISPL